VQINKRILILAAIILLLAFVACACLFAIAGAQLSSWLSDLPSSPAASEIATLSALKTSPTQTPAPAVLSSPAPKHSPSPSRPIDSITATVEEPTPVFLNPAEQTQFIFENNPPQLFDPLEIAARLNGQHELPRQLNSPPIVYQVGDMKFFWATDNDTNEYFQVEATLQYETEHVYFWIDNRVTRFSPRDLKELVETFEAKIYPTTRAFFGSEWTPGVDNDPHLYILYARGIGRSVAGYFSSADSYLPIVREFSNGHEMFLLNADILALDEEYTYGVLAHEFQHMIHWNIDRNEETWLNEGLSNLAMLINGYSAGRSERAYLNAPDLQLNYWSTHDDKRTANYGSAFLFTAYILDRFGSQFTQALVAHPENGLKSLDLLLAEHGVRDAFNGASLSADDIFRDWVIASWLQDQRIEDGRYAFPSLPGLPKPSASGNVRTCPTRLSSQDVSQYGVDYIRIRCRGNYTLTFDGLNVVPVLPTQFHSGDYAFYSNTGDESVMSLTRLFDFSQHQGDLTLDYWTWFDIENDYDYLYLMASTDGKNWQILTTPSGTPDNPSGNCYGWAYNGQSGQVSGTERPEWIRERVDISQFAGKQVFLRFEYITDAAVYHEGFLLDDVRIPEIGYFTDFEQDDGGWQAQGFVRIQNNLPQKFIVSIIYMGDETRVESITLDANNHAAIPLQLGKQVKEAILVVSGASRHTRQKAGYQVSIQP
jgi:immune inhibitor A